MLRVQAGSEFHAAGLRMRLTDILSRTVSKLSQINVQLLDTAFLRPPWERLRAATHTVHLKIHGKAGSSELPIRVN